LRILSVTAGAGGMYCGSCLRDNVLAGELQARGHDVTLLPVYTPTRTDEENVSESQVFFSGISVYLEQNFALFRKTPAILDFVWDTPAVIRAATGRGVSVDPEFLGDMTVSMLRGEQGNQAKEFRKLLRHLKAQPAFDVVMLPTSLLASLAPPIRRELGVPIVCTLSGEDLFLEGLATHYKKEAKSLIASHAPAVTRFVATSDYYAEFMASYLDLPRRRIATVPIGIRFDGFEPAPAGDASRPFTIGYMARIAPEKGLHLLASAYIRLRRELGLPESRLEAAGYLAPEHRTYLEGVTQALSAVGLEREFVCHGTIDRARKLAFLRGLDVLSVPSPYAEPKGLYLLEALATGVPVVEPKHGTFPEVIEKTGGGVLFAPNDARDLADRLLELHQDPARRLELGRRGSENVRRHYSAASMAERTLAVCEAARAAHEAEGAPRS
jgi:glycosyltransferase involved in cell wall biosynthesis